MIETIESERARARGGWTPAPDERAELSRSVPFLMVHLMALVALFMGGSAFAIGTCFFLYFMRMFAITAGYHRYFSHASYKTGRVFQFLLGLLGTTAAQQGPLWWAAHHRRHHRFSDTEKDPHSPVMRGIWWAHVGWILCRRNEVTHYEEVESLAKFPELRWLNDYHHLSPFALAAGLFFLGGWLEKNFPGLGTSSLDLILWGFFMSTVLLYHGTFTINSLAHVFGSRRFATKDDSRNNLWLALITLGEGWHNNHHRWPTAERQGYYWWEIDVSHAILKALSWVGVVWDLREPPAELYEAARKPAPEPSLVS